MKYPFLASYCICFLTVLVSAYIREPAGLIVAFLWLIIGTMLFKKQLDHEAELKTKQECNITQQALEILSETLEKYDARKYICIGAGYSQVERDIVKQILSLKS